MGLDQRVEGAGRPGVLLGSSRVAFGHFRTKVVGVRTLARLPGPGSIQHASDLASQSFGEVIGQGSQVRMHLGQPAAGSGEAQGQEQSDRGGNRETRGDEMQLGHRRLKPREAGRGEIVTSAAGAGGR